MNDEWLNFRHLFAFWTVARTGSFTRAATQMRVAQSAVSAQVAELEGYFEERLLVRNHRSVSLTPFGQELLGHASGIFAQSRAINSELKDKKTETVGRVLRVGVVGGASRNFVFRLIERYRARGPRGRVVVTTGSYEELYGLLRRSELDTIVTLELPKKADMGVVTYRKLGESRLCIAGVPQLIVKLRGRRALGPVEVFMFRHPFEVEVLERHVRPRLGAAITVSLETDDVPLLRFFANSGEGLAVLPRVGLLEDLESGIVDAIDLDHCPEVNIYGIALQEGLRGVGPDPLHFWPLEP
ncbi:MAG: LysR family transcriptional regulator [Myxococcaceae bacterium]|nr:LysR family transcriptional regulator [Myxococcaceae bacterium]